MYHKNIDLLKGFAGNALGLNGKPPNTEPLMELVAADADITSSLLEAVVPAWNIDAGIKPAQKFLETNV